MSKGYLEYKLPFIFSSSEKAGAQNVSADGSSFNIILDQPIFIPREAKNCSVSVSSASAWNTIYNVELDVNDKITISYNTGIVVVRVLQIDPGLYDLDHLSEEIQREIHAVGWPQNLIQLIPDNASQKSVIQFNYPGVQIDFTGLHSFYDILGFEPRLVPLAGETIGVEYEKSDNTANFNKLDYLLIHTDLVSRGIRINHIYQNVVHQMLIDVEPGSQIVSTPFTVQNIPSPELIGERRKNVRLWLTNQDNERVNTNGEIWSIRLIVHYYM